MNTLMTSHLDFVRGSYATRSSPAGLMPVIYQIEPTSRCNLNCVACPNSLLDSTSDMSYELFTQIIDECAPYALAIKLSYLGEPLLHPNLPAFVEYAKEKVSGARVSLHTNATPLTHQVGCDLIVAGLDELIVSIDAFDADTLARVRPIANRGLIWRNLEDFLLFKQGRSPDVHINCVHLDSVSARERNQLRDYWQTFGVIVRTSPLTTWGNRVPQLGPTKHSRALALELAACAELWYKTVVSSNGEVVLCCNDFAKSEQLGNVRRESINAIWNGQRLKHLRRIHAEGTCRTESLCGDCCDWSTSAEMEATVAGRPDRLFRP